METMFILSALFFAIGLLVRGGYELLKGSGRVDPENKPLFILVFSAMCLLWISWFNLCPVDPIALGLPAFVRWVGLGLFVLGTILAVGALIQLRGVENIDHLVTNGLFKRLRHPMYAGFCAWFLGWSLYHDGAVSLGLGLLGILCVFWWRSLEDRRLVVQFGAAYEEYRRTTWF